ncbi:bifunctional hydroxymethylpyrimidine kinase/phosphomethylpyrimidine kinase [Henriciella mobilis]|uniref:bifunctional hydroxymethylpyrimidine kinase/phosphomethylpyrimidine kinase n=1 Tax=Henriciella mobilis TaxID=2305467 RepID=UPI000E671C03|nr:bifunctional hydroxymethylpyrimidine kinase/phosphomethylpyrimidine kinase [Henriciella mobilis]RIJ18438.1 bifunctional hydroxymethylpyrimidine kinase/phosphomethylpyrimidine kinase [Henriciella mobilis]RIJ25688.1 bifunctional hydroxymethylpyrimidine kinase/phosphomethylpyrimidine kinase [Henriciella mobilis]
MTEKRPDPNGRVLVVAGSDSGGGAGIQADIKAIMATGGYAMTAITAITVQDTTGVHDVHPVPLNTVRGQMAVCLNDIGADAIKTGMLGTADLVELVAETLDERAPDVPRIVDPVMVATSGDRLIDERAVEALMSVLMPGTALLTPNAPEAEVLSGKSVDGVNGQRRAAEALLNRGAKGVLVKGGHIPGRVITDVLQTEHGEWLLESERIVTTSTHGTGCTLASAIASLIAQGQPIDAAVETARDYLHGAIQHAKGFGSGHGPVDHGWTLQTDVER